MQIDNRASARKRLPNRRASETSSFECAGLAYAATVSQFADGEVAEIFLSNHKSGSHADTAAKDCAVVCSIALQYCVPLETGTLRLEERTGQDGTRRHGAYR